MTNQNPTTRDDVRDNTPIPVRHLSFEFDERAMSKYCWGDNAFSSAFILTFSLLIPHGERFVIRSVRAYRDRIRDPELRARVNGLIGQEAMHSKVHEEFNAAYAKKGIRIDRVERASKWYFERHLPAILPVPAQLAVTCAIEHMTAMMAERSFLEPELHDMLDVGAREFIRWHLLEEAEHKSVAFDVYQEQVGNHWLRTRALQFVPAYTGPLFAFSMQQILTSPGFSQGPRATLEGFDYWFGKRGYFARLQPRLRQYARRDYHPGQIDTDAMLLEWQEKLFGEGGMLTARVKKVISPPSPKN
jgi:uncharacterized protein